MKAKNLAKVMAIVIAVICIMAGTISYGANTTNTTSNKSNNRTNTTETKKKDEGLAKLKIEELELSPKFETTTYEYTVNYIGESESLTIDAEPTEAYYDVKVIGNSKLEEGENLITILVTDADEKNIATYQITVNKSLIDEKKQEEAKKQEYMVKIAGGISAGIIILLIIILIVRAIKNRREDIENWENWASNENDENEEYEEEELPKALRDSKKDNNSKGKRYK